MSEEKHERAWAFAMPGNPDVLFEFRLDLMTSNVHIMIMQNDLCDQQTGIVETVIPVSEFAVLSWNFESMNRLMKEAL